MEQERAGILRFLSRLALLAAAIILLLAIFLFATQNTSPSNLYLQNKLLASSPSPKLVMIGGSNCLFGVDSEMLEHEIDVAVVDYCLQAGLPLGYSFREVLPHIQKDDVVVLIMEYGFYANVINPEAATSIIDSYPPGIPSLLPDVWQEMPDLMMRLVKRHLSRLQSTGSVFEHQYNRWGDGTYLLEYNGEIELDEENGTIPEISQVDRTLLIQIEDFNDKVVSQGGKVFISYPSMWNRQYDPQTEKAEQLDTLLRERFPGMVISSPADYVYRKIFISNTSYHLNREGRAIRTKQLIADLLAAGLQAR